MQVIIEVIKCNNDRYDHLYNIRAVQKNGAPIGMPEEYGHYVYHPIQIARAVRWVRDDVTRNIPDVLDIQVDNFTAVEL